jgi:cholesterol transport system auxiliary component
MTYPGTMKRSLVLAILLLTTLSGCLGGTPPLPRDHFFRVSVRAPANSTAYFPGTISVAPIEAEGLLRERPLLYSNGGAQEVQQHDYFYWTEAPPRMLQVQLVDFLRDSGAANSVITPDLRVPSDYEVTGRIRRLERLLQGDTTRVVAELELAMTKNNGQDLIVVQSYGAEIAAENDSVAASVQALDSALSDIFTRFVADADAQRRAQSAAAAD